MKTPATFLRSKVAHGIVLLFFACALLPVALLMIVSSLGVTSQLRQESQKRLTQESKGQGMEIFERLTIVESSLMVFSSEGKQSDLEALKPRFNGLSSFNVNGGLLSHSGTATHSLSLALPSETSGERTVAGSRWRVHKR